MDTRLPTRHKSPNMASWNENGSIGVSCKLVMCVIVYVYLYGRINLASLLWSEKRISTGFLFLVSIHKSL
jgi:hypothetical protein